MSETPLTQQMIDTPVDNGTEKRGLSASVSRHALVTGGLVVAGAGLAYAVGRLVTAAHDEEIARDGQAETTGQGNATENTSTDQKQDLRFEKARTGAVAVTGNVEQGPPQQQNSPTEQKQP
jgi:hypothetical protein